MLRCSPLSYKQLSKFQQPRIIWKKKQMILPKGDMQSRRNDLASRLSESSPKPFWHLAKRFQPPKCCSTCRFGGRSEKRKVHISATDTRRLSATRRNIRMRFRFVFPELHSGFFQVANIRATFAGKLVLIAAKAGLFIMPLRNRKKSGHRTSCRR